MIDGGHVANAPLPTLRPFGSRVRLPPSAIAQRIDQQRENGRPLMARRIRQMVVRQRPAR